MGVLAPYYGALVAGILIGAAGQLLLKTGAVHAVRAGGEAAQLIDRFTLLGLGFYGAAAMLYIVAIRKIPLSIAYPSVSLSYAIVVVAAHYLWDEPIGWAQLAGIVLILAGILLLNRGF